MSEKLMSFRLYEGGKLSRTAGMMMDPKVYAQLSVFVEARPHLGYVEQIAYRRKDILVDGQLVEVQWHRTETTTEIVRKLDETFGETTGATKRGLEAIAGVAGERLDALKEQAEKMLDEMSLDTSRTAAAEFCSSVSPTDERCVLPAGHDGCHQAEPSIPGTCATVWVKR